MRETVGFTSPKRHQKNGQTYYQRSGGYNNSNFNSSAPKWYVNEYSRNNNGHVTYPVKGGYQMKHTNKDPREREEILRLVESVVKNYMVNPG